ncbi:hypothetical protein [Rosenbergiella nectarea]|uniref:hypothetical protein n=1 Tax=Rosenbergiella nectarea TaxID=988801 RepID=UPI001F4EB852|nr:hypothetical protein [Rosenbergiella nectarea]
MSVDYFLRVGTACGGKILTGDGALLRMVAGCAVAGFNWLLLDISVRNVYSMLNLPHGSETETPTPDA